MSKDLISGFLIDIRNPDKPYFGKAVWERKADWKSIYDLLDCSIFTIASRRFGKYKFDILLDDEGLLKTKTITGLSIDKNEMLVGNLFVCNHNDDGEVVSLTDDEIKYLHLHVIAGLLRYSF